MSLEYNEIKGLINLLKDSEQKTLELIAKQINSIDHSSLKTLDSMANESEDNALVDNWYQVSRLSLEFAIKDWKRFPDLETGTYLVAKLENPGIDSIKCKEKLDEMAHRAGELLAPDASEEDVIKAINQILFDEENFSGNQIFYYDLKNNFIDSVFETKTGNPITLSTIYILIARRLKVKAEGIGTPGHFIIKIGDKFIDPFFNGKEISKEECQIRAQELGVFWREEYLQPVDDLAIISRSLRNLVAIYKKEKNFAKSADVAEILHIIQ